MVQCSNEHQQPGCVNKRGVPRKIHINNNGYFRYYPVKNHIQVEISKPSVFTYPPNLIHQVKQTIKKHQKF